MTLSEFDIDYVTDKIKRIGGVDEVGRGPLFGEVVVCCVMMPLDDIIEGINDSKKLSEKKREKLFDIIIEKAIRYEIAVVDNREIDKINILNATKRAMKEAIERMSDCLDLCIIDALKIDTNTPIEAVIKGDAKSYNVACASILAKVTRDRMMLEYDKMYPQYDLQSNKGYGTAKHIEALRKYGPTKLHRKTFIGNFVNIDYNYDDVK